MTELLFFGRDEGVLEELAYLWKQKEASFEHKLLTITAMLMTMKHQAENDHRSAI